MKTVNNFYSTYSDEKKKQKYDIAELGTESERGMGMMFSDNHGNVYGGETTSSPTTQRDYDEDFYRVLMEIDPPYEVQDFLTYHFNFYKSNKPNQEELFMKHIQYVILPWVKQTDRPEYAELISTWLTKNNAMLLQKQLQEKNEFLRKSYEVAVEYSPASPLSVNINPIELGESIGLDEATTTRIVQELVEDGYVRSGIGMAILFVTQQGLNYLRNLELKPSNSRGININVGHNSNFQIQQGNINSRQQIEITNSSTEELKQFVSDIRTAIEEFKKHLSSEKIEELKEEVDYLDRNLNRQTPNKSIIGTVTQNIWDILKAVPSNIIANTISNYIQNPQ